jgi:hypothetical protein
MGSFLPNSQNPYLSITSFAISVISVYSVANLLLTELVYVRK